MMAKLTKKEIKKRIKDGWIYARMWFEVLALTKEAADASLKQHVEKLEKFPDIIIVNKRFMKVKKVKKPFRDIEQAFSKVVRTEVLVKNVEALVYITIMFGPSAVEIIEPLEFKLSIATVQSIVNTFADLVHRFAAMKGGLMIPIAYAEDLMKRRQRR